MEKSIINVGGPYVVAGIGTVFSLARLTTLQRESVRIDGEKGQLTAAIAQAGGKIAETELQILQLDQNLRSEVTSELREVERRIGELAQRRIAADDQLDRLEIRSPEDGVVHELVVHTVGGVVNAGEVLMRIVPQTDRLAIEAKVAPEHIDQISPGQAAMVLFSALSQRTTPELKGEVTRVGADITQDEATRLPVYVVRIELPPAERERLGDLKLVSGMPVEIYIQTETRTALSYLVKQLADQIERALR